MVILTILILPIHEHSISFHLFASSSIVFISVSVFWAQVFTSLGRFIPSHFILFFDAMVNEIVYLISLSLLVYRNAIDFYMLILYPYEQLLYIKGGKNIQWRKKKVFNKWCAGKTGQLHGKEWNQKVGSHHIQK